MLGNVIQDAGQRSYAQRVVLRNRDMMFSAFCRRQAHVAASLPRDFVAERFEGFG